MAFVLFVGLFNQFRELRRGVSFWLCSLLGRYTWVLTIQGWFVMLGVCLVVIMVLFLFELVKNGDLLLLIEKNASSYGSGHGSDY